MSPCLCDERPLPQQDRTGEVTIPLEREIESLNVAVAAGILLERLPTS